MTTISSTERSKPVMTHTMAVTALVPLVLTFILGTLCLQGFNLVFAQVGQDVGAPQQASLITALPSIILGIVCFVYGSLGDFVSLRKLVVFGIVLLTIGSILGFVLNMFFAPHLWTVIIARMLQTAGEQTAGSVYLVVTTKYLKPNFRVIAFGVFTAAYQLSASIGVFAAGWLSTIHWQYLFLIPLITIFFLPTLMKNLPNTSEQGTHVDGLGFVIFGTATMFLTLFFTYQNWNFLTIAGIVYLLFAVYISTAKNPFITPEFFRNKRWIASIMLIAIFYFTNYAIAPLFIAIGAAHYNMSADVVSHSIVIAFIVAAIVGTSSGVIIRYIGRRAAIIIAALCMIVGFFGTAFMMNAGFSVLTAFACIFYAGMGLLYSPIVDTVLSTINPEESGRGVGMNDLIMNATASIGISIFGTMMSTQALNTTSITGATGFEGTLTNILTIGGCIILVGLVYYCIAQHWIYADAPHNANEKADTSTDTTV